MIRANERDRRSERNDKIAGDFQFGQFVTPFFFEKDDSRRIGFGVYPALQRRGSFIRFVPDISSAILSLTVNPFLVNKTLSLDTLA